jgi:hypothetical protein
MKQALTKLCAEQWPRRLFKVPVPMGWRVVVTEPKLVEEMCKAPEYILSSRRAVEKVCKSFPHGGNELSQR